MSAIPSTPRHIKGTVKLFIGDKEVHLDQLSPIKRRPMPTKRRRIHTIRGTAKLYIRGKEATVNEVVEYLNS